MIGFGRKGTGLSASDVAEALEKAELFKIIRRTRSLANENAKVTSQILAALKQNNETLAVMQVELGNVQRELGELREHISGISGLGDVAGRLEEIRREAEGVKDGMASTTLVTALLRKLVDQRQAS